MKINPRAGQLAIASDLVDVPKLIAAYYEERPDPDIPEQRVVFGTLGHRGFSFEKTFNEWHILAITQAICLYRKQQKIDGPLFLGIDTHDLAGEKPITIMTKAAGDGNAIGGIKVAVANGWFAARPSGAEAIYKIYAESFSGEEHLALIEAEAQTVANQAFASATPAATTPQLQETN